MSCKSNTLFFNPSALARVLLVVMPVATTPLVGRAQDTETNPDTQVAAEETAVDRARAHFQKGIDYYTDGDLTAALIEFQQAYQLQPTYRLLYNLGQVTYEQRDYVAAERYFRAYLEQGKDEIEETRRREVEKDLERLKGRVADLQLRSNLPNAKFFVDEQPVGAAPLSGPIRVSAGRRRIRAESPGRESASRVVDVVGGEAQSVDLEFGPALELQPPRAKGNSSKVALWTGIGTGALALATAGMAYWTNSDDNAYSKALEHRTSRSELDSLASSTEHKALVTDILLGTTIVTGAVTLILLLTDDHTPERAPSSGYAIHLGPGSVRATF